MSQEPWYMLFVVVATALTVSIRHAIRFAQADHSELGTILNLSLFRTFGAMPAARSARRWLATYPSAQ